MRTNLRLRIRLQTFLNCFRCFWVFLQFAAAESTHTQYVKLAEVTKSLSRSYPRLLPERIVGHGNIAPREKLARVTHLIGQGTARFLKVFEASYS
jgi:hypothetical protein